MSTNKSNLTEATATAKFTVTGVTPDRISPETGKLTEVIKKHPAYATTPEVQQVVAEWVGAADKVTQSTQQIKAAQLAITSLMSTQAANVAAWKRAAKKAVATIDATCGGSADAIKQWGLMVANREILPASQAAPAGLRARYTKAFVLIVRWNSVDEHLGYFLQVGDGTQEGWGASIPCTRAKYLPQGLLPGQKVAFRLAVQRKNGQSAWSDALVLTVR